MDYKNLFFSFQGRINRGKFWLAILIYFAISIVMAILGFIMGQGTAFQLLNVAVSIVLFISGLAVGIKRLHDRDKSGWYLLLFYLVPGLLVFLSMMAGLIGLGADSASTGILAIVLGLLGLAVAIWAFVELGCLRGTVGSNKYGPDPLGGA